MVKPHSKSDPRGHKGRSLEGSAAISTFPTSKTTTPHVLEGWLQNRGLRETVESVVIAVVLAFLFRTFVAEPFVIPTGSMAPALQGRHQRVDCPICEFSYRVGASRETDNGIRRGNNFLSICPQCGFAACTNPELGERARDVQTRYESPQFFPQLSLDLAEHVSSSGGDRILVSKLAYEFDDPQRWDVFVFHFPGDASKNYIKRLVGLPGETLRIKHGDVFRSPDVKLTNSTPLSDFSIQRKPADVIMRMRQLVYDNNYAAAPRVVEYMTSREWPTRWSDTEGGWKSQDHTKSFQVESTETPQWLRYAHYFPTFDDWNRLLEEELPAPSGAATDTLQARPQLIADNYTYNSGIFATGFRDPRFEPPRPGTLGMNWTGDLIVECQLDSRSEKGQVILELVEGGIRFQSEIDLAAGTATLKILDPQNNPLAFEADDSAPAEQNPQASISMKGIGSHQVTFANVDDQLHLWIDGQVVEFDSPTSYPRLGNVSPTSADLSPVGIAAVGAQLRVDQMRLYRDVYYVASEDGVQQRYCDLENSRLNQYMREARHIRDGFESSVQLTRDRAKFLSSPSEWGTAYENTHQLTFSLEKFDNQYQDQFFAMGDNSPHSQDSRLWWRGQLGIRHFVERKLIIGRAMLIYWPLGNVHMIQ